MHPELKKALSSAEAQLDEAVDKLRQQCDVAPSPRERLERAFAVHLGPGLYLPETVEPLLAASPPLKRPKGTEEDESESPVLSTAQVLVRGQRHELHEFLNSDEFIRYTRSVTYCRDEDIDTTALPVGLRTRLEPWQLQGQHKLCQLADGPWRGGWLADAVGLGKSLTALVAALRIRNEKRLKGFVLVVCPKQCVPQWYQEVQKHWTLEHRPRAIILDKATYPVEALLQHDIVICSYSFLRNRYREADDHDLYVRLRTEFSAQRAADMMPDCARNQRISKPLHSSLYSALDASIAVAILDESQTIKNDDAMVTKSVCSLNYHYAFALTGTPLFNQWKDITGQLMAFPGYPFKNTKHFLSIFGEGQSIRGTALNDLKNFLASMMVARPKDVLKKALKEHIITDVKVILDDPMVLMRIAKDVKNAKWFLSEAGSKSTSDPKEAANLRLSGYAALTKAQCRSACPALLRGRDNIPDEIFVLMRDDDDSSTAGTEEEGVEKLLRLGEPADNDIPEAIDGEDDGEEADPTYNPDVGDVDLLDNTIIEDDEDDDMDSNERRELYRALPPQKRGEWLKELYSMPEAKISSPRVTTIINLIRDILRDFPGEKIVIVSRFVKFLDVLQLNIANQSVTEATEFNGFVPQDQRNENLRQFNRENGGPMVLLLSANAGGTGLNITRASHSILCEPQWSSGAVIQIRGRNVRLGQTRVVRSYNILVECSIDVHLKKLLEKKEVSNNSLMGDIVRPDNEPWFKDMAVDSPSAEAASPEAAEAVSPEAAEAASPEAAEAASQADCPSLDAEEVDSDTKYRRQQEQADLISNITEWLGIRAYDYAVEYGRRNPRDKWPMEIVVQDGVPFWEPDIKTAVQLCGIREGRKCKRCRRDKTIQFCDLTAEDCELFLRFGDHYTATFVCQTNNYDQRALEEAVAEIAAEAAEEAAAEAAEEAEEAAALEAANGDDD